MRSDEDVLSAFVADLSAILAQGYTGNVTIRVQHGIIRNYRTEQVRVPGEMLLDTSAKG